MVPGPPAADDRLQLAGIALLMVLLLLVAYPCRCGAPAEGRQLSGSLLTTRAQELPGPDRFLCAF